MSVDIYRGAVGGDRHAHEDIDIADDIAAVEPELRQRFDEIAKAAMCAADAVAQEVVGLATASVDRVVSTASIFQSSKVKASSNCPAMSHAVASRAIIWGVHASDPVAR